MNDRSLRRRLDAALVLLAAAVVLLLALALRFAPETTVGLLVFAALLGYAFRVGR
ncbi:MULTISPECIES: hypothetical protein [Haloplanus]|uniref:hypothetical protein n=1 Tax=Haloplanus TaxID=376170 RepID=UPI0018EE6D71|nr:MULTISPECIES: hypothetical protein [Haloplanus]